MATVATIVDRSLRLLGQIPSGVTPSPAEYTDAITALNAMMSSWFSDLEMIYTTRESTIPLLASTASYTIGPTGGVVISRPLEIRAAYYVDSSNISHPVTVLTDTQYVDIPDKTTTSAIPTALYYQPSIPNGTLYIYPVPSASGTLKVLTRSPPPGGYTATTDTITVPAGWEEAMAFNLAVLIAPEYKTSPSAEVALRARQTRALIARVNVRPVNGSTELTEMFGPSSGNILTG